MTEMGAGGVMEGGDVSLTVTVIWSKVFLVALFTTFNT